MFGATPTRQTRSSSRLSTGRADSAVPQEQSTPQRNRAANRYIRSPSQVLRMSPPGTNSRSVLDGKRPPVRIKEEGEGDEAVSQHDDTAPDATSSTSFNRSRAGGANGRHTLQPASFFVRERSNGVLPHQNSFSSAGNHLGAGGSGGLSTNQLLRGAQKPSFDPYSPSHSRTSVGMHSILSSEPDDSRSLAYDYQAEERLAAELEEEEMRRNGAGPSRANGRHRGHDEEDEEDGGEASDGSDGSAFEYDENVSSSRLPRRRKPRSSKDNLPYRPDQDDEDRDSDGSTGGKKHSHRRRSSRNDWPRMREGRDDNKIWCGQKKKRRSPRKKDENGNDIDDSFADTTLESYVEDTPPIEAAASVRKDGAPARLLKGVVLAAGAANQRPHTEAGSEHDVAVSLQRVLLNLASFLFSAPLMAAKVGWQRLQGNGGMRLLLTWVVLPLIATTLLRAALLPVGWGSSGSIAYDTPGSGLFGLFAPSRSASRVLSPPDEPPTSFHDLSSRLTHLEGAFQSEHDRVEQRFRDNERRIAKLEDRSDAAVKQIRELESQFGSSYVRLSKLEAALKDRESTISAELRSLRERQEELQREGSKAGKAERSRLQGQVAKVEAELERARSLIDGIGSAQKRGDAALAEFQELVDPLRQLLPAQMPVRTDPKTGKLHIEPAFWKELKKVFATVDGDKKFLSVPDSSWNGFLRANRAALSDLVQGEIDQRLTKVLDRDTFLKLLTNEVEQVKIELTEKLSTGGAKLPDRDTLMSAIAPELDSRLERAKEELSSRFNDNVESLQNEILAKVRKQNQMYEEAGSWRPKGAKLPGSAAPSSQQPAVAGSGFDPTRISFGPGGWSSTLASSVNLKLKDGTDLKGSVMALIEAALEHYSADRIGRRDYALYSAGGRVIPELTTETYSYQPASSWSRWLPTLGAKRPSSSSSTAKRPVRGRPPLAALHPDTSPGMCWSFAGASGNLGVHLSRPTQVRAVSIEHTPRILTLDEGSSAPREVVVWGLVSNPNDQAKLIAHRAEAAKRALAAEEQERAAGQDDEGGQIDATPPPPSPYHFLLTTATYELQPERRTIQTFDVPRDVVELGVAVHSVQFQFLSNHGNPAFTCVYRVRVHGDE